MSVVTKNPFALLEDDGAPAVAAAPAGKTAPKAGGGADATKKAADSKPQQQRGGPAARSGRYPGRGGGAKSAPRDEVNADATDEPKRFDGEKARRGGTRGRGGEYRGRGRGRGGPRSDRPDRHSATGIVDSDKKLHQGWGGDTGAGEQLAEAQGAADAQAAGDWSGAGGETSGWDAPAGGDAAGGDAAPAGEGGDAAAGAGGEGRKPRERRPREDDEDDNLQTFAEYRKTQTSGLEELVPKLEGRRANDGAEDSSLFKGAKKLEKDEDEENYFIGKTKAGPRARTQKEAKQIIEIDGRFDRPSRGGDRGGRGGGGYRGGRGGGPEGGRGDFRGGRGRGGPPRGGPPRSSATQEVNVDDANAFPSLS